MDRTRTITPELLDQLEKQYDSRPELAVLSNVMSNTTLFDAAFSQREANKLRMDFAVEVPTTGITAQKISGRCWMFATMNLAREHVVKKCNMKDFALSGIYLTFYDKLEKANYLFESILSHADDPIDSRENRNILSAGLGDGGFFDMAVSLFEKYGCVPDWIMPENAHSENTENWKLIVDEKIREDAIELRRLHAEGKDTSVRRNEMLAEVYQMLAILLGKPPKTFDFEYKDKDGVYHCERDLTPMRFYKEFCGGNLKDYVCLLSVPHLKTNQTYIQPHFGNVLEDEIRFLNITMEEAEDIAIRNLKDGNLVFFACDSFAYRSRAKGYWASECFDYSGALGGISFGMTKEEKLLSSHSTPDHCMVLCGVNFDRDGKPDRWKIENSWGESNGQEGYYVCSESWFQESVMMISVNKAYLSDAQISLLEKEPETLAIWDPVS